MKSVLYLATAWTIALLTASPATAQSGTTRTELLCGADRPLVYPGDSVVLRGWVVGETEPAAPRRWHWQAAVGSVSGDAVAVWRFGPAESPKETRLLIATVQSAAAGDGAAPLRCDVEVVLADRPKTADGGNRGNELKARAFLLDGREPPTGYGMYSFLLLDAPALTEVETERQINAIATFLLLIQPAAQMEAYRRISQLNLALLPVKHELRLPEPLVVVGEARKLAAQVLKSYDYARAQALLADFCVKVRGSGPFLVASRDRDGGCRRRNLLMDMSQVTPNHVPGWITTFRSRATAERSWGDDTMADLALRTRQIIAVTYRDATDIALGMSQWVRLLDSAP